MAERRRIRLQELSMAQDFSEGGAKVHNQNYGPSLATGLSAWKYLSSILHDFLFLARFRLEL